MNKGMKRIMTVVIALLMVLAMSATSFAGSKITLNGAVKKALKNAGVTRSQVRDLDSEYDDGKYEVEFKVKKSGTEFEYEISGSGRILEKSVDYKYKHNSSRKKIGKKAAIAAVAKKSGIKKSIIKRGSCNYEYDSDDHEGTYDIEFTKGNYEYEYEVLAPTGKIIEYSKEYIG